jgi:hypothetical protein
VTARPRVGALLVSVALVALGTLLLLNNFQVLDWGVWRQVVRLWPVVFVLGGAWLFLRHARGG